MSIRPEARPIDGRRRATRRISAWALLVFLPVSGAAQDKLVAVTFDDLPYVGGADLEKADAATAAFVAALIGYRVPATAFVTTKHVLVSGQTDERLDLLRSWRDAGASLANHAASHLSLNRMDTRAHLDDVLQGDLIPRFLMEEVGGTAVWYRAPFNHTGDTIEKRRALDEFLDERGFRLAPFTVEHSDYMFDRLYRDALAAEDRETAEKIGEAYLRQLEPAFEFAEQLSMDTFGRLVPQVFLIHANAINARYLDAILEWLDGSGYRFVSLDDAVADEAYGTTEGLVGGRGISWLHRWRDGLGLEDKLREEPDPPKWIIQAYEERTANAKKSIPSNEGARSTGIR